MEYKSKSEDDAEEVLFPFIIMGYKSQDGKIYPTIRYQNEYLPTTCSPKFFGELFAAATRGAANLERIMSKTNQNLEQIEAEIVKVYNKSMEQGGGHEERIEVYKVK